MRSSSRSWCRAVPQWRLLGPKVLTTKEKKIACASEEEMSRLLPSASMWRGSRCHATPAARGNGIEGILSQHA